MGCSYTAYSGLGIAMSRAALETLLTEHEEDTGCGHAEAEGKKFCPECGAKVEAPEWNAIDLAAEFFEVLEKQQKSKLDVTEIYFEESYGKHRGEGVFFVGQMLGVENDDNGGYNVALHKHWPNVDEVRYDIGPALEAVLKELNLDDIVKVEDLYNPETDFGIVSALRVSC